MLLVYKNNTNKSNNTGGNLIFTDSDQLTIKLLMHWNAVMKLVYSRSFFDWPDTGTVEERKVFAYALDKIVNGSTMLRDAAGSRDTVLGPTSSMSTVPPPDPSQPQLLIRFEEVAFVQRVRRLFWSTVMKKRVNFHFPLVPNAGLQARERQGCEPEVDSEQWQQRHQNVFH